MKFSRRNDPPPPPPVRLAREPEPGPAPACEPRKVRDLQVVPEGSRFGELLVRKQLVSRNTLIDALMEQDVTGKRIGALLVEHGALTERQLAGALAEHLDMSLADLRSQRPDPAAVTLVPESVAREHIAAPLRITDGVLEVVAADPSPGLRDMIEEVAGMPVRLLLAPASEVSRVIDSTYRALGAINEQV
jgi:hypothetical protein